jgi:hypothetical protein
LRIESSLAPALLAVALGVAGCATTATAPADASPASIVIPSSILATRPDVGRLVVRRDSGLLGVACDHAVRLDGKLIASLGAGEEATAFPNPGEHTLEASTTGAWCSGNSVGGASFVLEAGQSRTFRTGYSGFSLAVSQVSESRATASPLQKVETPRAAAEERPPRAAEPPTGKDAYQAEHLAAVKACNAQPRAVLTAKGPGFEAYMVPCTNGDSLSVRCEMGNCRTLR